MADPHPAARQAGAAGLATFVQAGETLTVSSFSTREHLLRMASLAQRVFEPGQNDGATPSAPPPLRPNDWFLRKIEREAIVPALSLALHAGEQSPDKTAPAIGLALIGHDRRVARDLAFLATLGLRAPFRQRGWGSRLFDLALCHLQTHGIKRLETLAESNMIAWYRHRGATSRGTFVTAKTLGLASKAAEVVPTTSLPSHRMVHCMWPAGSWQRTIRRHCWRISPPSGRVFLAAMSLQGTTWMLHEVWADEPVAMAEVLPALRAAAPRAATLLAPHLLLGSNQHDLPDLGAVPGFEAVQSGEWLVLNLDDVRCR